MAQGHGHGIRIVADRYRLEHAIARGGMGTVWHGRDEKLDRPVAVKVLSTELATLAAARSRFEREARVLAKLRSAHVVEVYDFGIQEKLPYIVMELLDGESLASRLRRVGRLPLGEAAAVLVQILKGLRAAHAASLIHRDLKPSNIFLARRDDGEVVKLLDFGVVKIDDPSLGGGEVTVTGLLVGTPQYMSPEQARATRDIDHRSDLWSAGVILFRMLAGHNPFQGESVGDVVLKICSDELPQILDERPELPAAIGDFFARALDRDPARRFQSAEAMAQAIATIAPVPEAGASLPAIVEAQPMGADAPWRQPSMPDNSSPSLAAFQRFDSTPTPGTVGGTQLPLPLLEAGPRPSRQPLAIVVGAVAILAVTAFAAVIWIGSEPAPPVVDAKPAAAPAEAPGEDERDAETMAETVTEPEPAPETTPATEPSVAPHSRTSPSARVPPAAPVETPPKSAPSAVPAPEPKKDDGPTWF
jgi:eukaryotic-like serine/threonine-protein kinase